jgi:hypothetical protein
MTKIFLHSKNKGILSLSFRYVWFYEKWEIISKKINDSVIKKNNKHLKLDFAGKYDPITLLQNGKEWQKKYKNSFLL